MVSTLELDFVSEVSVDVLISILFLILLRLLPLCLDLTILLLDTFFIGLLLTIWEMDFLYRCIGPVSELYSILYNKTGV